MRSPINEHSSEIQITVEDNASKNIEGLKHKLVVKDDPYGCDMDGTDEESPDRDLPDFTFYPPGEEIDRIESLFIPGPSGYGMDLPFTCSGYVDLSDVKPAKAAFDDIKGEGYDIDEVEKEPWKERNTVDPLQKWLQESVEPSEY